MKDLRLEDFRLEGQSLLLAAMFQYFLDLLSSGIGESVLTVS